MSGNTEVIKNINRVLKKMNDEIAGGNPNNYFGGSLNKRTESYQYNPKPNTTIYNSPTNGTINTPRLNKDNYKTNYGSGLKMTHRNIEERDDDDIYVGKKLNNERKKRSDTGLKKKNRQNG